MAALLFSGSLLHGEDLDTQDDWVDLFEEDSFALWQQHNGEPVDAQCWSIEDGVVHFVNARWKSQGITTRASYLNFELRFEWKISEVGNSGVKYRISPNMSRLGLEYQLLDDQKHPDRIIPSHQAGSLYDLFAAPAEKPINPVGDWNQARILVNGNQIQHWMNGTLIIDVEYGSDEWRTAFENSKYSQHDGFGSWEGPILIQDHGDEFWIRNMQIREL